MAKRTGAVTRVPEVLPAESEDVSLVTQAGDAIREFVQGVALFFREALALEQRSKATEMGANALQAPTDAGSDEVLQRYAKRIQAEKKEVESHWEITTLVHALHRRLTARRKIALDHLERGAERINTLHNRYVDAERRRVAEETERNRQQLEREERDRQNNEALRLEQQALEMEAASKDLSDREQQLVALLADGVDAMLALRRVGYKDPAAAGKKLLALPKITQAISAKLEARNLRQQASAVKEQPVEVEVERARPNITKGIAVDRTTWGYEIVDERAFIAAYKSGQYGIPDDCVAVAPKSCGALANALHENLDRIPGIRHTKNTRMV